VRAAAGAIVGGTLAVGGRSFDVEPGFVASAAVARRWTRDPVFATGTLSAGVSFARTREQEAAGADSVGLRAVDVRLGVLAGVTVAERFSPYLLARAFAGPVAWELDGEAIDGSDQHHYQLGLGASVALPARVTAQLDASLLGERSVSVAAAMSF
jgi:hypothetical protein